MSAVPQGCHGSNETPWAIKDPALIARAKADLVERTKDQPYASPIPADAKPPLDMAADAA